MKKITKFLLGSSLISVMPIASIAISCNPNVDNFKNFITNINSEVTLKQKYNTLTASEIIIGSWSDVIKYTNLDINLQSNVNATIVSTTNNDQEGKKNIAVKVTDTNLTDRYLLVTLEISGFKIVEVIQQPNPVDIDKKDKGPVDDKKPVDNKETKPEKPSDPNPVAPKDPSNESSNPVTPKDGTTDPKPGNGENNETIEATKIKIASWNLLNYSGDEKQANKTEILTKVMVSEGFDIVAANEISNDKKDAQGNVIALNALLTSLRKLDPESKWNGFISPQLSGKGKESQKEWIIFLFKSSKVEPLKFQGDSDFGKAYINEPWKGRFEKEIDYIYARPPFGMKFQTIGNIVNDFTIIAGHLDSPGKYTGTNKSRVELATTKLSGQGNQEVEEALQLSEVAKWFDGIDGVNDEIIILGDTNIRQGNEAKAFETLINEGYVNLFDDSKEDATTLSSKVGEYANPYDKIFYKGSLQARAARKWDLFSIADSKLVDWDAFKDAKDKERGKKYSNEKDYFGNIISDHTSVSFDIILNSTDEKDGDEKVANSIIPSDEVKVKAKTE
ncbi:Endonuclease/Exonuclease/phosphatase family protein [Mycoplasma testudineum]|uniref:Endonuclease/Exonuclease/phosphatase family protein n=1 Tax=Mycoplasma testudineum TaxID=244584 RepID=A0A4R6IDT8_9MOLU|nr:endonuclease/exonuclease/phosphatase family protein [Mycoplasma testudineum]OYD26649.1 hypothetical protein CG473_02500 [Mycoplasma testudineum]TDO19777.1 Endonuclease/Exonuclease/phosphatase family protein [Mycoplasma testudineum]